MMLKAIKVIGLVMLGIHSAYPQYLIEVEVKGLANGEAYLGYHLGASKYIQDTTQLIEGTGIFQGDESLSHGIYFLYTPKYFLEFVVTGEQEFKIASDTLEPLLNKQVTGSRENELFHQFQLKLAETQSRTMELRETLKEASGRDDSTAIINDIRSTNKANMDFQEKLASENEDSYVATLINLIHKPEDLEAPAELSDQEARQYSFWAYRDQFWDGIDFGNEGILRTPLFLERINEYVDRLVSPEPDSLIKAVDFLIQKAEGDPDVFRYVVVTLTNKFAKPKMMGHDAVFVHLAEQYYLSGKASWASEKMIEDFRNAVNDLKPNLIGQPAPSLQLLDTLLSPVSLDDIDAKYTVLFFYDPDCGHCKTVAPQALDLYHQYQNDGVMAMGVCITTDLDKWKKFIEEKSLDWINAADPYYQSNFRKEYNIVSTPTIYILDQDKKIIGKRIAVEQLEDFLNARMRIDGD